VVLTTYNLVRIQHERMIQTQDNFDMWLRKRLPFGFPQRGTFPLFVIHWWFVILDEAHRVANPNTSISVAVRALPGLYRLPMTGTPLQNDYTDIQGLLGFMRILPWSNLTLFKQVSSISVWDSLSSCSQLRTVLRAEADKENTWRNSRY
jgi:SNF2 family DNA or RNA helicase